MQFSTFMTSIFDVEAINFTVVFEKTRAVAHTLGKETAGRCIRGW
jgi:hypothetical protein